MNRDFLKKAIKKLVLKEIANNQFGTPIQNPDKRMNLDAEKKLKTAMGKDADVHCPTGTGKISGVTEKQEVTLSKNAEDCYDVISVANGSERKIARGVSLEEAMELVKKHAKDSEKTYVQKAYDKTSQGHGLKKSEKEEKKEADKMDDVDEETQLDIADDTTEKADVKVDKKLAPINKDVSAPMGGDIVDKIEKIIDRVLKDKADAKTAHLKVDKDVQSPDKLTTKLKDTPALKEKKQGLTFSKASSICELANASVVQVVEQASLKRYAVGSSPIGCAIL